MADSEALRTRRSRAHRAGDHSLCVRCTVKQGGAELPAVIAPVSDAESELRQLAGQLAAAYRNEPGNALLARELRMTLQALLPGRDAGGSADDLEAMFADL